MITFTMAVLVFACCVWQVWAGVAELITNLRTR